MHPIVERLTRFATLAAPALVVLAMTGCYGEVYGDPSYPSATFVASEDPVYYDGYPTYYYGNRWYFRNGGRWGYYRNEPGYLHSYRAAHPTYGRAGVRGGVRGGARGGFHGGGHGGRR